MSLLSCCLKIFIDDALLNNRHKTVNLFQEMNSSTKRNLSKQKLRFQFNVISYKERYCV